MIQCSDAPKSYFPDILAITAPDLTQIHVDRVSWISAFSAISELAIPITGFRFFFFFCICKHLVGKNQVTYFAAIFCCFYCFLRAARTGTQKTDALGFFFLIIWFAFKVLPLCPMFIAYSLSDVSLFSLSCDVSFMKNLDQYSFSQKVGLSEKCVSHTDLNVVFVNSNINYNCYSSSLNANLWPCLMNSNSKFCTLTEWAFRCFLGS